MAEEESLKDEMNALLRADRERARDRRVPLVVEPQDAVDPVDEPPAETAVAVEEPPQTPIEEPQAAEPAEEPQRGFAARLRKLFG